MLFYSKTADCSNAAPELKTISRSSFFYSTAKVNHESGGFEAITSSTFQFYSAGFRAIQIDEVQTF